MGRRKPIRMASAFIMSDGTEENKEASSFCIPLDIR